MCCSCGNAAPCVQVRNHGGGGRIGWPRAPPHSCPRRLSVSSATVGQAGKAVLRTTIRSRCIPFTQSSAVCRLLPRVLTAHASCVACFRVPAARRPEVAVRGPQTVTCSRLSILEVRCFAVCAAVRHRIAVRSSQLVHSLALRRRGAALQRPRAQGATERPACARKKRFPRCLRGVTLASGGVDVCPAVGKVSMRATVQMVHHFSTAPLRRGGMSRSGPSVTVIAMLVQWPVQ